MTLFSTAYSRSFSQFQAFDVEDVPVYFSLSVTGTGWTEAGIETIIINYVDGLGAGGNIVAADLTALLVADSTIDSVDSISFSRQAPTLWEDNAPETVELFVFSTEQATTDAAKISLPTLVDVYIFVEYNATQQEEDDCQVAIAAAVNALSDGEDVLRSLIVTTANGILGASAVDENDVYIGETGPPSSSLPASDLTIDAGEVAYTEANDTYIGVFIEA